MVTSIQSHSEPVTQLPVPPPETPETTENPKLRRNAELLAQSLGWVPNVTSSEVLADRWQALETRLSPIFRALQTSLAGKAVSDDVLWLHENANVLSSALQSSGDFLRSPEERAHVQTADQKVVPRVLPIAENYLKAAEYKFTESSVSEYLNGFQEHVPLNMSELWGMIPVLKLVLLEEVARRAEIVLKGSREPQGVGLCIRSLMEVAQTPWKDAIEPLISFDKVLRQDPAGAYSSMDFESRDLYRSALVNIANHSDATEFEVATSALQLAKEAAQKEYTDRREKTRASHVGYYLIGAGKRALYEKSGFYAPVRQRIRSFVREHPDEFFLLAIEVLTLVIVASAVLLLTTPSTPPFSILFMMLVLLLPASQSAVQLTNYFITSILQPRILPKLDLSEGIPSDYASMVAIPSLLLNEQQVRKLVDDLEVRYLGNRDRNLYFGLLTDLADSPAPPREDDPLVDLCVQLIQDLNEKYAAEGMGSFFMFHRHRVYNPRERVWMGWERKRGKLMDFDDLIRGGHDSFPVKAGNFSILPQVRYVITLDADTKLPRGSAHRLIGAIVHPLNQAIIDPKKNIVVAGYGIVQPRVGVSVKSSARSRLARIYSGQTGLDIYTCAVSDVYQDLYEEGSFAGKGVYEVDVLRQVLGGRFPHNALLSHDLIEGAYAGAGLASDIQIIEDYPSHYSAYNRRKHRWLRGDWQIVEWLLSTVPGQNGQRVSNPLSTISKWKILDNLRRSLVEPATFTLLVLGWLVMPGRPWAWTLAALAILFVPAWCRFLFEVVRAVFEGQFAIVRDALSSLFAANISVFLNLTFLAHQALLSVDAAVRATIRRILTHRHMLEWETAAEAEAESGVTKRTPVEMYLDWTPALALVIGLLIAIFRRPALWSALPILVLWGCSKLISLWLNLPPRQRRIELNQRDRAFARNAALRTWRYFQEFSTRSHNWLIPDNVQEEPYRVAPRISPTNLGLLLNSRQAAKELGYITVPEFAELTTRTLTTMKRLSRVHGHLVNWYDTQTLEPLRPSFVSTVDSGNLVASLWSLTRGSLETIDRPLLEPAMGNGVLDCARALSERRILPRQLLSAMQRGLTGRHWLQYALNLPDTIFEGALGSRRAKRNQESRWFIDQGLVRLHEIEKVVRVYTPWLLPEFESLRSGSPVSNLWKGEGVSLKQLPDHISRLETYLQSQSNGTSKETAVEAQELLPLLATARHEVMELLQQLRQIASDTAELANQMEFGFLLHKRRKLLAVGFEVETNQITSACYDLLASEARMAAFIAIAKGEISQDLWFRLSRLHTLQQGRPILLSWSGTMFEYLMPSIWMRTQPDTLLARSQEAAVRVQAAYGAAKGIPWGISESAYATKDKDGNYGYFAFGIPSISISKPETNGTVISPYSTFLALLADAPSALHNLRKMARLGWLGRYGFYDSADFSSSVHSWRRKCEVVKTWMAHHQGMSLLSVTNLLCDGVFQRWFHQDRRVQATELLLEEKPVAVMQPAGKYGNNAA